MRTPLKRTMALVVAALALTGVAGFVAIAAFGGSSAAGAPSAAPSASQGAEMTVTGRPLYELSQTEFMFAAGQATYRVAMDIDTRCVNSRGKLLGGYQFVSRIAMITSLPLTITGTLDGTTLEARTILLPTTKDAIT